MTDCEKNNINCPPRYKNIGSSNFGDKKKVTAELLYQFCKNDSYLYDQVKQLWDKTDPEHRKRFYAPYYMDSSKSYGIEPLVFDDETPSGNIKISDNDIKNKLTKANGKIESAYHLSNTEEEVYRVNFDSTDDRTYWDTNSNGRYNILVKEDESIIEDTSTLKVIAESKKISDIEGQEIEVIDHTVLPQTTNTTVSSEIPFRIYEPVTVTNKKTVKKKVVTKKDVYGKLSLDAMCNGPYKNWHSNSVWYIGYNRHKNYNVKNAWRKNPDSTAIPSVCRAQTFKAQHTGELRKVVLLMKGSSKSVSPCIVEIRTVGKNGKPTSKVLAKTEQKFNHSSKALVNFTFKKPCKVKKGTQYAIVVRSPLSNFNHCYWLGGWASTCFSNSKKRAYYDGETFLSENNGKTWIVHGKREKCYGSHYYDWGFAEAPVNFGFEVYIAPKTGTKKTTKTVPKTTTTTSETMKEINDYVTASIDINYYEAGEYYLEFKPFVGNFYTGLTCIYDIEPFTEGTNIGEYTWEIFNSDIDEQTGTVKGWQEFRSFGLLDSETSNITNSGGTSHTLKFNKALTFVKLRLKLRLEENILDGWEEFEDNFRTTMEKLGEQQGLNLTKRQEWAGEVVSKFGWKNLTETPLGIRKLDNIEFHLFKKPSFKGYLRTLDYHPVQEGMLPACIWSEVDADVKPKNNGRCKVDIVHEHNTIDHIQFFQADSTDLKEYILLYYQEQLPTANVGETSYSTSEEIRDWIIQLDKNTLEVKSINRDFIKWLENQNPKVYLLPYHIYETVEPEETSSDEETEEETSQEPVKTLKKIVYFGDWTKDDAPVKLGDYPAYPINSCSCGTDDIHLNFVESVDNSKLTKKAEGVVSYTHTESIQDKVKDVSVVFKYLNPTAEVQATGEEMLDDNYEIESHEKLSEEKVLGMNSDYVISDSTIDFTVLENTTLADYLDISEDNIRVKDNDYFIKEENEIIIEMIGYDYNEFQDYLVDYDTKTLHFYEPLALVEGEMKVNYNPLWVRDLSPEDFPLKMDLWTEYYKARVIGYDDKDNPVFTFDKMLLNSCGKPVKDSQNPVDGVPPYIQTSVPPLDNIRELDLQDDNLNSLIADKLVEDEDYYVDYLTNKIYFTTPLLEEGMLVMVKYTPNLTDNGLSLAYRLSRPLYDSSGVEITEDVFIDKSSYVNTEIEDGDDVYCLSNYFTTRT